MTHGNSVPGNPPISPDSLSVPRTALLSSVPIALLRTRLTCSRKPVGNVKTPRMFPSGDGSLISVRSRGPTAGHPGRRWVPPASPLLRISLLIHHRESVKVVQDRLGHSTATMTLDTYGHLWPATEDPPGLQWMPCLEGWGPLGSGEGRRIVKVLVSGVVTVSRPVSGILSPGPLPGSGWVAIHLCGLPGEIGRAAPPTFDLAPGGVCRAARVTPDAGALLPHRFTLTCDPADRPAPIGGLFSVALSCGSPRLAVSQHPALRSPDFPRPGRRSRRRLAAATQPAHRHHQCRARSAAT